MHTYTTCPGCGDILEYRGRRHRTHPGCADPQQWEHDLEDEFLAAAEAGRDDLADQLGGQLDAIDDHPPRLADAAMVYAAWGWPVFPLKPGHKTPYRRSRGYKDATTDPGRIRAWWAAAPDANIGIPTGLAFDVLDVDFRHGALQPWLALRESPAMPDAHGIASTGHNGMHVLLTPAGLGNHAKMGGWPGLDYRGAGGYIVAAPSVLDGGRSYAWDVKPSPAITHHRGATAHGGAA